VNIVTQSNILIDYLVNALVPLVEDEARREISDYLDLMEVRRWADRPPRQQKRGRKWRNRSLWRPEGHAVTRKIEELRAARAS
jgi:hypothetical protein